VKLRFDDKNINHGRSELNFMGISSSWKIDNDKNNKQKSFWVTDNYVRKLFLLKKKSSQ
jgi:hypothetical protein